MDNCNNFNVYCFADRKKYERIEDTNITYENCWYYMDCTCYCFNMAIINNPVSFNGRTRDFDSRYIGSNPVTGAIIQGDSNYEI